MPYITPQRRVDIEPFLAPMLEAVQHMSEGEMNYIITRLVLSHLTHGGALHPTYGDFQEAVGLLECVKLEFYRRMVVPYEDEKTKLNGDVFI